ncbi:MAG: hypothetical protein KDD01_15615 [Phaeodactylibacter sp.]|nr:hypothetical protein [Phaeodactylibacter sp.]
MKIADLSNDQLMTAIIKASNKLLKYATTAPEDERREILFQLESILDKIKPAVR